MLLTLNRIMLMNYQPKSYQQTEEELLPMVAEEDIILQSYNLTNDN